MKSVYLISYSFKRIQHVIIIRRSSIVEYIIRYYSYLRMIRRRSYRNDASSRDEILIKFKILVAISERSADRKVVFDFRMTSRTYEESRTEVEMISSYYWYIGLIILRAWLLRYIRINTSPKFVFFKIRNSPSSRENTKKISFYVKKKFYPEFLGHLIFRTKLRVSRRFFHQGIVDYPKTR